MARVALPRPPGLKRIRKPGSSLESGRVNASVRVLGPVPSPFHLPRNPGRSTNSLLSHWTPHCGRDKHLHLPHKPVFHVQDVPAQENFQNPQLAFLG